MVKYAKTLRGRIKQIRDEAVAKAEEAMVSSKNRKRNQLEEIENAYNGNNGTTLYSYNSLAYVFDKINDTRHKDSLYKLAKVVYNKRCKKFFENSNGMASLANVSFWSSKWIRKPEEWKPKSYNFERQLASLVRHLLAEYYVPLFMDKIWLNDRYGCHVKKTELLYQEWWIHIGMGGNIRKATNFPIPYTKKMAIHFLKCPPETDIVEAIRIGQVIGLGGSKRLANAITNSLHKNSFGDDEIEKFWRSVIYFFVNNPMLDLVHIQSIIDYIYSQKYVAEGTHIVNGMVRNLGPPHPNFSMKGRTVRSLLKNVNDWHRQLRKYKGKKYKEWSSCGVPGFEFITGKKHDQKIWKILEITNSKWLHKEGKDMRHCVFSYEASCAKGISAIYSLTRESVNGIDSRLTIEIDPIDRRIHQMRMKCNAFPTPEILNIVKKWAIKRKLSMTSRKY